MTHLSIALANYLVSTLGFKTALLETGERNVLRQLSSMGVEESFRLNNVSYFPQVKTSSLGQIMTRDFTYIILDLGCDFVKAREELFRCDGKIIIGSLSPWRKNVYYDYIERIGNMLENMETCTFLALFGDKVENKRCRRICRVPMKSIPFIADPFKTEKEHISFLNSLI